MTTWHPAPAFDIPSSLARYFTLAGTLAFTSVSILILLFTLLPQSSYVHSKYARYEEAFVSLKNKVSPPSMDHKKNFRAKIEHGDSLQSRCKKQKNNKNVQLVLIRKYISCLQILGTNCHVRQYSSHIFSESVTLIIWCPQSLSLHKSCVLLPLWPTCVHWALFILAPVNSPVSLRSHGSC